MKKNFLLLLLVSSFLFPVLGVSAQEPLVQPQPYWNIESNLKTPKQSVVYFYTASHELMYKENVSGRKLNAGNKKTVKQLNAALSEVVLAWQSEKRIKENEQIIAKRL